jgi:ribonucleotide reductase beta subunit family protein with ferritin-like domain
MTTPTGLPSSTSNVFLSLAAGITCTHEEAEHQIKSLEDIKASQKQEVKVPKMFEELVLLFVFYSGIATILFGKKSALVTGITELIHCICRDKNGFKTCIAGNKEFATKFIFAIEIRIQCWLRACMTYDDQSMIDDWLVNFNPIIESVLNSRLNILLPPNFIIAPTTKQTNTTVVLLGDVTKKRNTRRRKTANGNNDNNCMVKNTAPVKEFLLKEGEDWSKDFSRKCTGDHPKWGDTDWMCAHWWVKGKCFRDCENKASHVGACAIPPTKHHKPQYGLH